ncbi:MAG: DUF1249 domain-containing protein [Gammaproteobacteria bacterium]
MTDGRRYRVDLPLQIAEYDANYLRLWRLFPRLREDDTRMFELPQGAQQTLVIFTVIERGPYTTLVELRQSPGTPWLEEPWLIEPRMRVRLYHDARSAEVVEFQGVRQFRPRYDYPNARMHQPDEKAQVNRFLSEFLAVCLAEGTARAVLAPAG